MPDGREGSQEAGTKGGRKERDGTGGRGSGKGSTGQGGARGGKGGGSGGGKGGARGGSSGGRKNGGGRGGKGGGRKGNEPRGGSKSGVRGGGSGGRKGGGGRGGKGGGRKGNEPRGTKSSASRPGPRTGGGGRTPSSRYKEIVKEGVALGFKATSTTGGKHNKGSLHSAGKAVDFSVRGKTKQQVDRFIREMRKLGYRVRDERTQPKGQKVWTGPHIHVEVRQKKAR